jgi:hypothetical protein
MSRVLVAAFALWLPAATGQGGKATCIAAETLARTMTAPGARPHLSCHGESGTKKGCCCKGQQTLRSAACHCHDGQAVDGATAHDPMLASWTRSPGPLPAAPLRAASALPVPKGQLTGEPETPPPRIPFSDRA